MKDLEADGIGDPIIIDNQIMIPIGETVYSGKLELSFFDLIAFMNASGLEKMTPFEAGKALEKMVKIIESKFTPDGIILNLRNLDNASWVIETFLTAYNEYHNTDNKEE